MIGEGPESGSAVGEGMGIAGVAQVAPGQQQAPDPNFSILGQPLAYDPPTRLIYRYCLPSSCQCWTLGRANIQALRKTSPGVIGVLCFVLETSMTSAHVFQDDWAVARVGMGTSLFSGFCEEEQLPFEDNRGGSSGMNLVDARGPLSVCFSDGLRRFWKPNTPIRHLDDSQCFDGLGCSADVPVTPAMP